MASLIKIKRSPGTTAPSSLSEGELAYSYGTGSVTNGGDRLYFGNGSTIDVIGGKYFTAMLAHTPGKLTASSALVVDSSSKLDNLKVDNLDLNGNTISSTDENGNIVLDPNGNGVVDVSTSKIVNVVDPSAAQDAATKNYVDTQISNIGGGTLTVQSPDGTPSSATLNFKTESLEFDGNGGLRFAITEVAAAGETPGKIVVTANLSQSLTSTDSVTFASVTVDETTINNNAITTTNGTNLTLTATGAEVIANSLTVSDLTSTRVVLAGTNGALTDSANLTFNENGLNITEDLNVTGVAKVTGSAEIDNIKVDGNTISSTGTLVVNPSNSIIDFSGAKLTNIGTPTADTDAATKAYVDGRTLTVDADSGTDVVVNLASDDLQFVANANGLSTSVAKSGTDVTVTFALAQDIRTTASPSFVGLTLSGDAAVNGGDLTTTATTFNLVNTTATTVNFAQGAANVNIGAATSMVTFGDDVTITGDLTVNGTTITANVATIEIEDPLIKLARGNTANALDIGFFGEYGAGAKLTGLFRDASDSNKYKLFADGTVADNQVTVTSLADLVVGTLEGTIDGGTY